MTKQIQRKLSQEINEDEIKTIDFIDQQKPSRPISSTLKNGSTSIFVQDNFTDLDDETIKSFARYPKKYALSLPSQLALQKEGQNEILPKHSPLQKIQLENENSLIYPTKKLEINTIPKLQIPVAISEQQKNCPLCQLIVQPQTKASVYEKYFPSISQMNELVEYGRLCLIGSRNSLVKDIVYTLQNKHNYIAINVTSRDLINLKDYYENDYSKALLAIYEYACAFKPCFVVWHDFDTFFKNSSCVMTLQQILKMQIDHNAFSSNPIYFIFITQQPQDVIIECFKYPIYVGFIDYEDRLSILKKMCGDQLNKFTHLANMNYFSIGQFKAAIKKAIEGEELPQPQFTAECEKSLQEYVSFMNKLGE